MANSWPFILSFSVKAIKIKLKGIILPKMNETKNLLSNKLGVFSERSFLSIIDKIIC